MKDQISRRAFVKSASAAGLLLSARGLTPRAAVAAAPSNAFDQVALGRSGVSASFLAFGTGVNGYSQSSALTRMGDREGAALLRYGFDQGINFIDTADLYGSHRLVPLALKDVPREKYVILSKIWTRNEDWLNFSGGAVAEVERFRKELDTDMIDVVLLHCLTNDQWPEEKKRMIDELNDLKAKGVVRAVGVSCHDFGALEVAAEHPWVEVILARINNRGGRSYSMDGTTHDVARVLKTARVNGKGVIGMKVYGVGKLTGPDQMNASLRYVMENQLVDAITIGMVRKQEVDDNLNRVGKALRS